MLVIFFLLLLSVALCILVLDVSGQSLDVVSLITKFWTTEIVLKLSDIQISSRRKGVNGNFSLKIMSEVLVQTRFDFTLSVVRSWYSEVCCWSWIKYQSSNWKSNYRGCSDSKISKIEGTSHVQCSFLSVHLFLCRNVIQI